MQRYENISDEELISRLRDGESDIIDYIIEKYKGLVKQKAKSMYLLGADHDDLLQEGMIGLYKAVRDYDFGRDASFFTFAELCITRQLYTAVQASQRKKHSFLNGYVSLYEKQGEQEDNQPELLQVLRSDTKDPEELTIDRENLEQFEQAIEQEMSTFEKQVMELLLIGMNYTEIARVLGRTDKAIDNAIQRIKTKVKRIHTSTTVK
ncbi:MAG: sigma-70 family RNA polymerase sigma factor [Lachnospiraceae bacterium]|nr:sigma-70 family RNA polymerase sigma factor [Lachnospiraceae bacterium]